MNKQQDEDITMTTTIITNNTTNLIENNNILNEPTFNIQYYIDNRDEYPQYFIDAIILLYKSQRIEKTEQILLMSKTEIQRITNLNLIQIDQLLLIVSKSLIYHIYKPATGDINNDGGEQDIQMDEFNFFNSYQKPIELITSLELEKLPISSIKLSTGCPRLDGWLGGGISPIGITEIAGESGSGKTQLCIQLSLQAQMPFEQGGLNGACLYINTESQFPMKRLNQMYNVKRGTTTTSRNNNNKSSKGPTPLDSIFIQSTPTIDSLMDLLVTKISGYLEMKTVRLLIIDSIAALFRHEYGNEKSEIMEKTKLLWSLANRLKLINEQYGITVVVVNQVTDFFIDSYSTSNVNNNNNNVNSNNGGGSSAVNNNGELTVQPFKRRKQDKVPSFQNSKQQHIPFILSQQQPQLPGLNELSVQQQFSNSSGTSTTIPALGLSWANFINTRFLLQRTKSTVPDPIANNQPTILRKLKIILSSCLKNQTLNFIIDASGVKCLN